MPFTPSHIAAALPFLRTPLIPAAVVVGTVTPDIPYYAPPFIPRDLSHSLLGAVTVDPLVGAVVIVLWWWLLREPVIDLLPRAVGTRLPTRSRTGWRPLERGWPLSIVLVLLSLLVGIATHLAWDSFTHPGWVVDHLTVLRTQLGPLPLEKWLQHASTVAGLVIVAVWGFRRLRRAEADPDRPTALTPRGRLVAQLLFLVSGVVAGLLAWISGIASGLAPFDPALVFLVARIGIGVALLVAALIVVAWYLLAQRARPAIAP